MGIRSSLVDRWPEYLIEASLLGCFMATICFLIVLFDSPQLWLYAHIPNARIRTVILAVAVGLTAALLIHSPWGKRSDAHLNPAVTLAFFFLKRTNLWDAFFYSLSQILGATLGVLIVVISIGKLFTSPPILYAVTTPGAAGAPTAFVGETAISFLLMIAILYCVGSPRLIRFTGVAVGVLITLFILVEAPLSGTSMNPARTLASAIPGKMWAHVWIYLTGPPLGMLAAAAIYGCVHRTETMECAKLLHPSTVRCIHCGFVPHNAHGK
jgi:aquaporin Z